MVRKREISYYREDRDVKYSAFQKEITISLRLDIASQSSNGRYQ